MLFMYLFFLYYSCCLSLLFLQRYKNKKSFVKCFKRKADYSLNQSIFLEKYITIARIINNPKLPANRAKVSSWDKDKYIKIEHSQ